MDFGLSTFSEPFYYQRATEARPQPAPVFHSTLETARWNEINRWNGFRNGPGRHLPPWTTACR